MVRETIQRKAAGKLSACRQDKAKASESNTGETHLTPLDTSPSSVIFFCTNNTFLQDWGKINMLFIQNRSSTNALTVPKCLTDSNKTLSWRIWGETKQSHITSSFMLELWNRTTNLIPYLWIRITLMLNLFSMFLCSVCCLSLNSFQWSYCEKQNETRQSFRTASPCNL